MIPCGMRPSPQDPVYALRRQLAREIVKSLGPGSQHVIARSYGISQPRMSELSRGLVARCSVEWLIRRIHRMGGSVELTVVLGDTRAAWYRERFERQRARLRGTGAGVSSGDALIPDLG